MKVVQILYSGLGGHGNVAFSLMHAAQATGHWDSAHVFVGVEPVLAEYERICQNAHVEFRYVRTTANRAWISWPKLFWALVRLRPDAIVLHSVKAILPCAIYARISRTPLLAVEHQANELKRPHEWWISRLLMRLAHGVVVLTPEYRVQLEKRLGHAWRKDKVHLIANGVDVDVYSPRLAERPSNSPRVIGMAARMTSIKRQDILIDALALLCAEDGRNAWRLSLAGDGEGQHSLQALVSARKLDDVVDFPGALGAKELPEWFGTLDIYAHASIGETLSTSLLQAMAKGLPIVGSDVAGISNLLASGGRTGLLVGQTPEEFAQALRRIASEPDMAASLAHRAREFAMAEYNQQAMLLRYAEVIQKLYAT